MAIIAYAILQEKEIISQTNIVNIFPVSVPFQTITKILQANVVRNTTRCLPARSLRINKELEKIEQKKTDTWEQPGIKHDRDEQN